MVGPEKFNDVVIPAQAGIHGALASAEWIPRLTRGMTRMTPPCAGMTRMIPPVMLRVVAASRECSMDSLLRGNDELFEFCRANDITYFIAEVCALTPH